MGTDTLNEENGVKRIFNGDSVGNALGTCAEPKCENSSPAISSAIIWRGNSSNPYPSYKHPIYKDLMAPCLTCADPNNQYIYQKVVNGFLNEKVFNK